MIELFVAFNSSLSSAPSSMCSSVDSSNWLFHLLELIRINLIGNYNWNVYDGYWWIKVHAITWEKRIFSYQIIMFIDWFMASAALNDSFDVLQSPLDFSVSIFPVFSNNLIAFMWAQRLRNHRSSCAVTRVTQVKRREKKSKWARTSGEANWANVNVQWNRSWVRRMNK